MRPNSACIIRARDIHWSSSASRRRPCRRAHATGDRRAVISPILLPSPLLMIDGAHASFGVCRGLLCSLLWFFLFCFFLCVVWCFACSCLGLHRRERARDADAPLSRTASFERR